MREERRDEKGCKGADWCGIDEPEMQWGTGRCGFVVTVGCRLCTSPRDPCLNDITTSLPAMDSFSPLHISASLHSSPSNSYSPGTMKPPSSSSALDRGIRV